MSTNQYNLTPSSAFAYGEGFRPPQVNPASLKIGHIGIIVSRKTLLYSAAKNKQNKKNRTPEMY
jgi:hypothetical protein